MPKSRAPARPVADLFAGLSAAWRDRSGRFSALRLAAFLLALAPGLWLLAALAFGAAGPKPVETTLNVTGVWTVRFLLLSLCVTPFRRIFGWGKLIQIRRMLGLTAASYAGLHFSAFVYQQNFDLLSVGSEIALRVYLAIGFLALAGLAVLAVTSTDRWIRKLGARWGRLHALAYPIGVLALLHFMMQSKADAAEATFMVGLFALLMAYRLLARRRIELSPAALALLAVAAVPAIMGFELAWYAAMTTVPVERVWEANFYFDGEWRPAWRVALTGLAVALAALIFRWRRAATGKA